MKMKLHSSLLVFSIALLCSCSESPLSTELSATGESALAETEQAVSGGEAAIKKRIADAEHGGRPLTADLNGANEVPGPGDPDGTGFALITLNQGQGEVCFEISVENILLPAIGAHIHVGTADVAGGVVVALTPPGADGTSSGCVSEGDRDLIKDIRQSPGNYYVNVHTTDFPPGAVRGQLTK